MLKIAFYIESMVVGGAEKVLIDLVNLLAEKGYDITVIAIYKKSVYTNYTFQFQNSFSENSRYRTLVNNENRMLYKLFNYCYAHMNKRFIYRLLVREKYDVEIAFYEGMPTEFVSNSTNAKSKKIAWLHTDNERLHQKKNFSELSSVHNRYCKFHEIVGVSEQVSQSFRKLFPDLKIKTIYNVINEDMIWKKSKAFTAEFARDCCVFLTVGRLVSVKGYSRLIRALGRLYREGYRRFALYMIGEGELHEELQHEIQNEGLSGVVTLIGMKSNPYPYMKAADYLVCTSLAEGFSTVVVEAVICELPILTTDCAGMREIFGENQCGIISENSEKGIYCMLKKALDQNELHEYYIEQCRKRKAFFNAEKRIDDVEGILKKR